MRRCRRRAMMLTQVLTLLPLMAAICTVAFALASKSTQLQGRERRLLDDQLMMHDLAQRIHVDARRAGSAHVETQAGQSVLVLVGNGWTITYRAAGHEVVRIEQGGADGNVLRYAWCFSVARADFQLERIGTSGELVWATFTTTAPVDRGPVLERRLALAAAVGPGGAS